MDELFLWTNETDFIIAESEDDCWKIYSELMQMDIEVESDEMEWSKVTRDFTLHYEDGRDVTKSVEEWIEEKGRGYFASTEY